MRNSDAVVIGGGLVGCATALALARRGQGVVVLEAEDSLAQHQSGRNSGVIHSGLYYRPGSMKARFTVAGRKALYDYVETYDIPHRRCGKIVVATREDELPRLEELERRGRANGLEGLERLDPEGIRKIEPEVTGLRGLWVPETWIVDFAEVNRAYARELESLGGEVILGCRFEAVEEAAEEVVIATSNGDLRARRLVNCGGLQADRIARMCGHRPEIRIVPFRGEYYLLGGAASDIVSRPVYPVPDPVFPFLEVHLTNKVDGRIEAGPNAVLALKREGYSKTAFRLADAAATLSYPGFWRLAARYWRTGAMEVYRSMSKGAFARSLARFVPAIRKQDLEPGGCGVRAQAMSPDGKLVDDFVIARQGRMLHVLNAVSPGATSSPAIGEYVATQVLEE